MTRFRLSLMSLLSLCALFAACQPPESVDETPVVMPPEPTPRVGTPIVEEEEDEALPMPPGMEMVDVAPVQSLGEKYSETYEDGDQPARSVGALYPDGQPMSRCWAGFTGGAAPEGEATRLEVILHPNALDAARPPEPLGRALVRWVLSTNRDGWTEAQVDFQWLEAESPLLLADTLMLYRADSVDGPWEAVEEQRIDHDARRVSATVTEFGHFMIFGERDPDAPTTRDIVDVLLGKSQPEPRLDINVDGTVDAMDVSASTMVGGGDLSEYQGM